jgi:hypothetical protein
MPAAGWEQLLQGWPWFQGEGRFPIPAYSEFMPPGYLIRKPYGCPEPVLVAHDDPWGWPITEYEEALTFRPGLERLARQLVGQLVRLGRGEAGHDFGERSLQDNPYWPSELAAHAGRLRHERFVVLLPLALSRTMDDKGRLRWTLFGGSEQGPAKPFWRSFFTAPGWELPPDQALAYLRRLLAAAYGEPEMRLGDLRRAGFRILPQGNQLPFPFWDEGPLPAWTSAFLWEEGQSLDEVKYLLTFRPFARLPASVRHAYLAGQLHLLPFPGSLLFWGAPAYLELQRELPLAVQIPLLLFTERFEGANGIRVPQAGWVGDAAEEGPAPHGRHGRVRATYKRTHRFARLPRFADHLASAREDRLAHALFSTNPHDVGLYHKPAGRNVQIWTADHHLLLDGPSATAADLRRAADALAGAGWFGYRFVFPAMRVGRHEVYWHRPLVACLHPQHGDPVVLANAPAGYLTAYPIAGADLAAPVELWPRLLRRDAHVANVRLFEHVKDEQPYQTLLNVRKLLDAREQSDGRPLPRAFARRLLNWPKDQTLEGFLDSLFEKALDRGLVHRLVNELRCGLEAEPSDRPGLHQTLTYQHTARRAFEVALWKHIAELSTGTFVNKNNADPVLDRVTEKDRPGQRRDLDALGDYLLAYHTKVIAEADMTGRALAGELPYCWQTDLCYPWMGGWLGNFEGTAYERNLVVVIPGKDRGRAVLMADHYDTAYMEDHYQRRQGGDGARLAARGADDNCSATATLMMAAPIFLRMSRAGQLACDVWLVHLTGEEFPAEGLGARMLCQQLVEGNLRLRLMGGDERDLSQVRIQGVYVMDMIGHNSNKDRDVFQIAPGVSPQSLWLATEAHGAAEAWNAWVPVWNRRPSRRGLRRGRRSRTRKPPPPARHLALNGEVRLSYDPHSTLFNTDGQTFSDAGVPVVLFMENYDINRKGYHDSKDTLENINLDYCAALSAIAIESVARAATAEVPSFPTAAAP